MSDEPIEVAVIGGGCASMAAAFELTRPELEGRYHVTVYQQGWRLGGKGASGRGSADRIEEHGLHIWLGFYENAFRLMRECYEELGRDPATCRIASWTDAFFPDPHVGLADRDAHGSWDVWTSYFPPAPGLPGDSPSRSPISLIGYAQHAIALLRTLIVGLHGSNARRGAPDDYLAQLEEEMAPSTPAMLERMVRFVEVGVLASVAGVLEALKLFQMVLGSLPSFSHGLVVSFVETVAASIRKLLETIVAADDHVRVRWEIIDLVIAIVVGTIRFRLLTDPRGLDAINDYECRDWLRLNGASERALDSAFVRGLYDLALAYEDGDEERPGLAAGQAIRGSLRMFFTYRGALFWKMRAGMGDVVFAPLFEVLERRGVTFRFFHRLTNVGMSSPELSDDTPHVTRLTFDVQAEVVGEGTYRPLVDVNSVPCWPSQPNYTQLVDGEALRKGGWNPENHWDRHAVSTLELEVTKDFDFVVLGTGVGEIPFVCRELLDRDERWRTMVERVKTVATQSVQLWLRRDMGELGWNAAPITLSAFVKPFDTWADMTHLAGEESWSEPPRAIAYFCSTLPEPEDPTATYRTEYPRLRHAEVRRNAVAFLNHEIRHLWPAAASGGEFDWETLSVPPGDDAVGCARLDSQFWTANVNPSDRYTLALPGTMEYRISPLDNTYDNMTVAGDWTDCGFNEGCVEAAVMSGRLAAHAISRLPRLEEIIGYDHP